jgi:hypothetical protein
MTISATVVADSISLGALRLTTIEVTFPHYLLEYVTSDSALVHTTPFVADFEPCLEPFVGRKMLLTSGNWRVVLATYRGFNYPKMHALADKIDEALFKSVPRKLQPGEWHLPYVDEHDEPAAMAMVTDDYRRTPIALGPADLINVARYTTIRVSVARCALQMGSVTQANTKGRSINLELALFSKLAENYPTKRGYLEHQYTPDEVSEDLKWLNTCLQAQPEGWIQYRKVYVWEEWKNRKITSNVDQRPIGETTHHGESDCYA